MKKNIKELGDYDYEYISSPEQIKEYDHTEGYSKKEIEEYENPTKIKIKKPNNTSNNLKNNLIYKEISATPLEYLAYGLPKQSLTILLLGLISLIAPIGLLFIQLFFMETTIQTLIPTASYLIIGLVFFTMSIIIYKNVIKKGEVVLQKEMRGGQIIFDKIKYGKKILFNRHDKTTEIITLWNGAGTLPYSGAKILKIKEGSASNDNLNLCVSESDWTRNLSSMVRAKTFADLAESELLENKGLFGMKWQDLMLILIGLVLIVSIFINIGLLPDIIKDSVMEALTGGALQNVIKNVMTPTVVV